MEDRAASALNRLQSRSKGVEPNPTPHFNVAKAELVQSGLISATLNGRRGKKCFNRFVQRCSLLYIQVRAPLFLQHSTPIEKKKFAKVMRRRNGGARALM